MRSPSSSTPQWGLVAGITRKVRRRRFIHVDSGSIGDKILLDSTSAFSKASSQKTWGHEKGAVMEDLYEIGGYGYRKIGFGEKLAILTVDLQNGVTNPKALMGRSPSAQDAVERVAVLCDAARQRGLPIIHCNTAFQPDLNDMPPWKIKCMTEWIIGSWEVQIDDRLWRAGDVVVCKKVPSIFFGTHCSTVLAKNHIDTVILTGANTGGCIRASAIDSFSLGFRTIVPRECVFDQGIESHEQNLIDIEQRYVDVEPYQVVLENLKKFEELAA